jgi:hypothetical protein
VNDGTCGVPVVSQGHLGYNGSASRHTLVPGLQTKTTHVQGKPSRIQPLRNKPMTERNVMKLTKEYVEQILADCSRKNEIRNQRVKELFGMDFIKVFNGFALYGLGVENVGNKENHAKLFKSFCDQTGIKPVFQYREEETRAEKDRYSNTTYGVYYFNDPDGFTTIRIDVSKSRKPVPEHMKTLRIGKLKPKCIVDIELFESIPLQMASNNKELKEFIEAYSIGTFSREELEELGDLQTLGDVEKIHTMFLVFEDNSYVVAFLGLGNNEPYSIREKSEGFGKNRFYRYSLVDGIEQTSEVIAKGEPLKLDDSETVFTDYTSDGKVFGLVTGIGVIIETGAHWKKADIKQTQKEIIPEVELKKPITLPILSNKLKAVFPQFSSYAQVFYDPEEKVKSFGHPKSIELLLDKGILGAGWQSQLNVASDMYLHGHNDAYRIKPITLLLYHLIELGEFEKIILATADGVDIAPLEN